MEVFSTIVEMYKHISIISDMLSLIVDWVSIIVDCFPQLCMIFHNYGVCFLQWYSMVRKPLVAESDLRRLHEDLPNILNLVKQGFPRRSVVDVDHGSDVPADPDKA